MSWRPGGMLGIDMGVARRWVSWSSTMSHMVCASSGRDAVCVTLVVVLVGVSFGCRPEPPPPAPSFRAAQVVGSPVEGTWERAAEQGLQRIGQELGAAVSSVRAAEDSPRRAELRRLGAKGTDLVFCVGAGFDSMLYTEAASYPDTAFVLLPGAGRAGNVVGVSFEVAGACYAGGVVAAALARKPVVAILHGGGGPWLEGAEDGFVAGFRSLRPDGTLVVANAPEGVRDLVAEGATVALYVTDRAEQQVLVEADSVGLKLVVTDPEALGQGPSTVLAAVAVDVPEAMVRVARDVREGTFRGRIYVFDVGSGVVSLVPGSLLESHPDPSLQAALDTALAEVTAGIVEIKQLGF